MQINDCKLWVFLDVAETTVGLQPFEYVFAEKTLIKCAKTALKNRKCIRDNKRGVCKDVNSDFKR